jgi:hypothetical protein
VKFLVGGMFEELAFAVVAFDLVLAEEDPVGEGEVEAAGGTVEGGIVAEESGADGFAIEMSADRLAALIPRGLKRCLMMAFSQELLVSFSMTAPEMM